MKAKIGDVLSWTKFFNSSKLRKNYPPKKIKLFNRLIVHTKNYFIISAYGAFTPGYSILITKQLLSSFAAVQNNNIKELKWLIRVYSSAMKKTYNREVVVFEHGLCACVGGLDRAHLHLMTINKKTSSKLIKQSIDETLYQRKSGVNFVEINGYKLSNIHDIVEIMKSKDASNYKINGKLLKYDDLTKDMNVKNWPVPARKHVSKGGHYVYFKSKYNKSSFYSKKNFQTQLGRQVVYEIEKQTNKKFLNYCNKLLNKNIYRDVWRWQNYSFTDEMKKTMKKLAPALLKIKKDTNSKKYNFKTYKMNV